MANRIYAGVNGIARQVKKLYVGVNGIARQVKKAYVGVNGTAHLCWQKQDTWQRYKLQYEQEQQLVASGDGIVEYDTGTINMFFWYNLIDLTFNPETGETTFSGGSTGESKQFRSVYDYTSVDVAVGNTVFMAYTRDDRMTISISDPGVLRLTGADVRYLYKYTASGPNRGSYIDTVEADPGTYPDNGVQGDYWYVKV